MRCTVSIRVRNHKTVDEYIIIKMVCLMKVLQCNLGAIQAVVLYISCGSKKRETFIFRPCVLTWCASTTRVVLGFCLVRSTLYPDPYTHTRASTDESKIKSVSFVVWNGMEKFIFVISL